LTRFDLIRIDPFSEDSNSLLSQVSSASNTPPHVRSIQNNYYAVTDTLLSGTPEDSFSSMVHLTLFEIVDLPLHQSIYICKSTKLQEFAYTYFKETS